MENQNKNLVLIEDLGNLFLNENSKRRRHYAIYKCFCGNEFKTLTQAVKSGMTKSCGCLSGKHAKTHNLSKHRLYKIWRGMFQRCRYTKSKDYKNYGARGIKVCDEWHNIENFINDMYPTYQEGLTLDRIDVDSNYSKDNCRWANNITQAQNRQKLQSNNTSGYRGVCWNKKDKKYQVQIKVNKKQIYLGHFNEAIDGAKAYDKYVIKNNLQHPLNFNNHSD